MNEWFENEIQCIVNNFEIGNVENVKLLKKYSDFNNLLKTVTI